MAGTSSNFMPNPFAELNPEQYPESKVNPPAEMPESKLCDSEDTRIFLNAMEALERKPPVKRPAGFNLAEHATWNNFPEKMKRKKLQEMPSKQEDEPKLAGNEEEKAPEADDFLHAMRDAEPLRGKGRRVAPASRANGTHVPAEASFEELMSGQLEFSLLYSDEYLEGRVSGLDEMVMNRLRAGSMSPEAHLDLHGLNALQAYESLCVFIRDSWFKGLRVVLLVPGRGKNSPAGMGILRQKLQAWLTQEPFKRVVLAFCTALPQDGGPGSIYVLLRKYRKKGRIYWNRLPMDADLY